MNVALLRDRDLGEVRIGAGGSGLGYQRNLSGFTCGQGGYFSPQRFAHGGVTLSWRRDGPVRWEAAVEPGYDEYAAAVSPVFPLSSTSGTAPGTSAAGASFNGHVALGIKLASHFETALTGSIQRAPQYQELSAGLVLRLTAP